MFLQDVFIIANFFIRDNCIDRMKPLRAVHIIASELLLADQRLITSNIKLQFIG